MGLGLLRLGWACARLASAVVIRVADAWVPLLIMLLLGLALRAWAALARIGLCSFGIGWTDSSRGRMGTAADSAWAGLIGVADAWAPLLSMLLLGLVLRGVLRPARLSFCSFAVGWTDASPDRMGNAVDYVAAWFGVAGVGLLRLGLVCARLA